MLNLRLAGRDSADGVMRKLEVRDRGSKRGKAVADPRPAVVTGSVGAAPFSGFLERDQYRQKRQRGRRRTFVISLGVHVLAVAILVFYSVYQVDELFGPIVGVKVMRPDKLPPGVLTRLSPAATPAPVAPRPAPRPR